MSQLFLPAKQSLRKTRWLPVFAVALTVTAHPAPLTVTVLDRDGDPVPDVAVYVGAQSGIAKPGPERKVMDQQHGRFVPHFLVVATGDEVHFPNSDPIAHHVYSFSRPNDFMLPLYKGNAHPPVTFEHAGVVTVGCNIHDRMLGFILVVDSAVYGKTNADGKVTLDPGDVSRVDVSIWSPRIRPKNETLTQTVDAGGVASLTFELTGRLRPSRDHDDGGLTWSDY